VYVYKLYVLGTVSRIYHWPVIPG